MNCPKAFLLFLLFFLCPKTAYSQNTFEITQVVINSCQVYIEVSVSYNPTDTISYQWFELDSSGNYVAIPDETFRTIFTTPGQYKLEVKNETINETISEEYTTINALNIITGFVWDNIKVGYSYDISLSGLKGTNGVHELSISYTFKSVFNSRFGCWRCQS